MNKKIFTKEELESMDVSLEYSSPLTYYGIESIFYDKETNGTHVWIGGCSCIDLHDIGPDSFKKMLLSDVLKYVWSPELEKWFIFTK